MFSVETMKLKSWLLIWKKLLLAFSYQACTKIARCTSSDHSLILCWLAMQIAVSDVFIYENCEKSKYIFRCYFSCKSSACHLPEYIGIYHGKCYLIVIVQGWSFLFVSRSHIMNILGRQDCNDVQNYLFQWIKLKNLTKD